MAACPRRHLLVRLIADQSHRSPSRGQGSARRITEGLAAAYGSRYGRIIGPIGGLTILLGVARGLIGGVWPILGSAYGLTWIASLVLGIGIAFVGARLTGPSVTRLAAAGGDGPLGVRADRLGRLELGLFAVLFSLMIVMRFGY
jgi:hypothetical protein